MLATLADVCIPERSAVFSDEQTARGVTAGKRVGAAIWSLLIRLNRAKRLLVDGTELTVQQAADIGLIHEAVADGEAGAAAVDRTLDLGLALEEQAFQAKLQLTPAGGAVGAAARVQTTARQPLSPTAASAPVATAMSSE